MRDKDVKRQRLDGGARASTLGTEGYRAWISAGEPLLVSGEQAGGFQHGGGGRGRTSHTSLQPVWDQIGNATGLIAWEMGIWPTGYKVWRRKNKRVRGGAGGEGQAGRYLGPRLPVMAARRMRWWMLRAVIEGVQGEGAAGGGRSAGRALAERVGGL